MRCLLVVALLAVGCTHDPEPVGNGHPAPVIEATAASSTSVDVVWHAATDAHRWWVIVTAPDGRNVAQRTACSQCRHMTVEHLAPSVDYGIRVVAVGPNGSFGDFPDLVIVSTPPDPGCDPEDDADICVALDATTPIGGATGVGLGGLHGVTNETDRGAVTALAPRAWRVSAGDVERFALARSFGGTVTVLLSDAWTSKVSTKAPWEDWAAYETFVAAVADAYIASGDLPDYWDVQNEPAPASFESGDPPTVELVLEQVSRAAAVIHALTPGRQGGRSQRQLRHVRVRHRRTWSASPRSPPAATEPWRACRGTRSVAGASVTATVGRGPLMQHADDVRAVLAGADAVAELHVNEWGAPWNFLQPGANVGYLAAIAMAGIDVANPTCWPLENASGETESSCFARPGNLAGRLLDDGRTPTDAWFTQRAYAQMTGPGFVLLPGTIADPHASVVGSVDPGGVIRVLLGRHTGCDGEVDQQCPAGVTYADDESVSLVMALAKDGQEYTATVERIRSLSGASDGPEPVDRAVVRVAGGRLQVGAWTVADGEAIVVTLTPT